MANEVNVNDVPAEGTILSKLPQIGCLRCWRPIAHMRTPAKHRCQPSPASPIVHGVMGHSVCSTCRCPIQIVADSDLTAATARAALARALGCNYVSHSDHFLISAVDWSSAGWQPVQRCLERVCSQGSQNVSKFIQLLQHRMDCQSRDHLANVLLRDYDTSTEHVCEEPVLTATAYMSACSSSSRGIAQHDQFPRGDVASFDPEHEIWDTGAGAEDDFAAVHCSVCIQQPCVCAVEANSSRSSSPEPQHTQWPSVTCNSFLRCIQLGEQADEGLPELPGDGPSQQPVSNLFQIWRDQSLRPVQSLFMTVRDQCIADRLAAYQCDQVGETIDNPTPFSCTCTTDQCSTQQQHAEHCSSRDSCPSPVEKTMRRFLQEDSYSSHYLCSHTVLSNDSDHVDSVDKALAASKSLEALISEASDDRIDAMTAADARLDICSALRVLKLVLKRVKGANLPPAQLQRKAMATARKLLKRQMASAQADRHNDEEWNKWSPVEITNYLRTLEFAGDRLLSNETVTITCNALLHGVNKKFISWLLTYLLSARYNHKRHVMVGDSNPTRVIRYLEKTLKRCGNNPSEDVEPESHFTESEQRSFEVLKGISAHITSADFTSTLGDLLRALAMESDGDLRDVIDFACVPKYVRPDPRLVHSDISDGAYTATVPVGGERRSLNEPTAVDAGGAVCGKISHHFRCTRVIASPNSAYLLECLAEKAIADGMDGVLAFICSHDATLVTGKRANTPLILRIANARGRVVNSMAAAAILSELPPLSAEDRSAVTPNDEVSTISAGAGKSLTRHCGWQNLMAIIRKYYRTGLVIPLRAEDYAEAVDVGEASTDASRSVRVRPLLLFTSNDLPELCSLAAVQSNHCPSCSARQIADDGSDSQATMFTSALCKALEDHGDDSASARQLIRDEHNRIRTSLRLVREAVGLPSSDESHTSSGAEAESTRCRVDNKCWRKHYSRLSSRMTVDELHQLKLGLCRNLTLNIMTIVSQAHAIWGSTNEHGAAEDGEEPIRAENILQLLAATDDVVQQDTSTSTPESPSSQNSQRQKRRRTLSARAVASVEQACSETITSEHPSNTVHDPTPHAAPAGRMTKADRLRLLQDRKEACFRKAQQCGSASIRRLFTSAVAQDIREGKDWQAIVQAMPALIGISQALIPDRNRLTLIQALLANVRPFALATNRFSCVLQVIQLLGKLSHVECMQTLPTLLAISRLVPVVLTAWDQAFPPSSRNRTRTRYSEEDLSQLPPPDIGGNGCEIRYCSRVTIKMHMLYHIAHAVITNGSLHRTSQAPQERMNAVEKEVSRQTAFSSCTARYVASVREKHAVRRQAAKVCAEETTFAAKSAASFRSHSMRVVHESSGNNRLAEGFKEALQAQIDALLEVARANERCTWQDICSLFSDELSEMNPWRLTAEKLLACSPITFVKQHGINHSLPEVLSSTFAWSDLRERKELLRSFAGKPAQQTIRIDNSASADAAKLNPVLWYNSPLPASSPAGFPERADLWSGLVRQAFTCELLQKVFNLIHGISGTIVFHWIWWNDPFRAAQFSVSTPVNFPKAPPFDNEFCQTSRYWFRAEVPAYPICVFSPLYSAIEPAFYAVLCLFSFPVLDRVELRFCMQREDAERVDQEGVTIPNQFTLRYLVAPSQVLR